MLNRKLFFLLFLISGTLVVNIIQNIDVEGDIDKKYSEIEPYIYTLSSIDINNGDFSDLTFLDTIIGNKQIVFLGEQLHSDGSTFQAKARLIRYLHEIHNFDIVLYEASIYDMWFMDQQAKQHARDTAQFYPTIGLYPFWWDNEDCKPLWQYYNKTLQSDNPITLGGFDIQLTGTYPDKIERSKTIKNFLLEKQVNIEDLPSFNSVIDQLSYTYKWEYKQFTQAQFDSIQVDLTNILGLLHPQKTETDNIYYRYLKGIRDYGQLMWDYNPGEIPRMNIRDSLMAENLIWQIDSLYNNQKIIVWSANIHLYKSDITTEGVTFTPLGKYIKAKFPNSYMMTFTSYALAAPNSQDKYYEAGVNSLEYLLHSRNYKYAYLDMNRVDRDSFLKKDFISVSNQRANELRTWNDLIDGLFYIDVINTIDKRIDK